MPIIDESVSTEFEVVYEDGRKMTVWLDDTDVHFPGAPIQSTDDPGWNGQEAGHAPEKGQWITYRNFNNTFTRSKAHCEYTAGSIKVTFEHIDVASGEPDPDEEHKNSLLFKDWGGVNNWKAAPQYLKGPFPEQPIFDISRL